MSVNATPETFDDLVGDGVVLVDFWGPQCQPCLALMPAVEALVEEFSSDLRLVKVEAPQNRQVCRDLRVMGLPTYILFKDGEERVRLTDDPTETDIRAAVLGIVKEASNGLDR